MGSVKKSPIQVAFDTNHLFVEGYFAVLQFQFANGCPDEGFRIDARLKSLLLPNDKSLDLTIQPGQRRTERIQLQLPRRSAGSVLFEIELIIDAGGDGRHRYTGKFVVTVIPHAKDLREINVHIEKIIDHHGESAGMGAINEINLSNFVNAPADLTVEQFLSRSSEEPHFVPVDLDYKGTVEEPIVKRHTPAVDRCAVVDVNSSSRLLVLSGDSITLGCSRAQADIVTWLMPRSDEADAESQTISREHCRLSCREDGPFVEHLSGTNPTKVDGCIVRDPVALTLGHTCELQLSRNLLLRLTALPVAQVGPKTMESWSACSGGHRVRRTGIGGVLIERTDGLAAAERYLWVINVVDIPRFPTSGDLCTSGIGIVALPALHCLTLGKLRLRVDDIQPGPETAVPVCAGDSISAGDLFWRVGPYRQDLGVVG